MATNKIDLSQFSSDELKAALKEAKASEKKAEAEKINEKYNGAFQAIVKAVEKAMKDAGLDLASHLSVDTEKMKLTVKRQATGGTNGNRDYTVWAAREKIRKAGYDIQGNRDKTYQIDGKAYTQEEMKKFASTVTKKAAK